MYHFIPGTVSITKKIYDRREINREEKLDVGLELFEIENIEINTYFSIIRQTKSPYKFHYDDFCFNLFFLNSAD